MTLINDTRPRDGHMSLPSARVDETLEPAPTTLTCVGYKRHQSLSSTFLRPFARRALPRFFAHMDALTPARRFFVHDFTAHELRPVRTGLLASCDQTFRPFRLQPPLVVPGTGLVSFQRAYRRVSAVCVTHPLSRVPHGVSWASPFPSRLATTTGRIEFVMLRTSRSPPVASHPASRRRSYVRLQSSNPTSTRTCTS
jgi:hypothetical protein